MAANEAMSQLEKTIRNNAVGKALYDFQADTAALLKRGWPIATHPDGWSAQDEKQLKDLLEKYFNIQIAPKEADKAVRAFLNNYAVLVDSVPGMQANLNEGNDHVG